MTLEHKRNGTTQIYAFVTDGVSEWLETQTYFGYTDDEARALYAKHLSENNLALT